MTDNGNGASKILWIVIGASIVYILLKGGNSTQSMSIKQLPEYNWEPLDKIPSVDDLKVMRLDTPTINQQDSMQQNSILEKIERLEQILNRMELLQASQTKSNPITQDLVNISPVLDTEAHPPVTQIQNLAVHIPVIKGEKVTPPSPIVERVEPSIPLPSIPIVKAEMIAPIVERVEPSIPLPSIPIVKAEMIAPIVKAEIVDTHTSITQDQKTETPSPTVEKVDTYTSIAQAQRTYKNNEKWKITRNKKGDIVSIEVVRNAEINGDKKQ